MSWQEDLNAEVEAARERAKHRPHPWWVRFDAPADGIFAQGQDAHVINRTLFAMREPVRPTPTDRAGVTFYPLDLCERIVAEESDMKAVMRCVRLTGLHGSYRKAGEEREYRF